MDLNEIRITEIMPCLADPEKTRFIAHLASGYFVPSTLVPAEIIKKEDGNGNQNLGAGLPALS